MPFTDRTEAGDALADRLIEAGVDADLVCAIPRGGLPVGRAVADRFEVPLDVVVATKLGAPSNPELAIGAVAGDGSYWLNDQLVDQLGVDDSYIDRERLPPPATGHRRRRSRPRGAGRAALGAGRPS